MITPRADAVASPQDLLRMARAIDEAAAEQFEDIAHSFAMSNNRDGAEELKRLAAWKNGQVQASDAPAATGTADWYVVDPGDPEGLHYLMRPWHLVGIAVVNEARMRALFATVAGSAADPALKAVAEDLVKRQDARIAELEARRATLPEPEPGWDEDPDPPFFDQ